MAISANKSILLLLMCTPSWAVAADAVFRSGLETSICAAAQTESEPNDVAAFYNPVTLDGPTQSAIVCGEINPLLTDVDYFRIALPGTGTLLAETIKADGADCDAASPQSLSVYDASLALLATDSGGGVDGCASLDGTINAALQNLPAGNYYLKVAVPLVSVETTQLSYALAIKLL
jgi:hypothetical protein